MKEISIYKEIFAKNGIKYSLQKELILLELIRADYHLTADQIYQRLKNKKIGIATVYRNLKLFTDLNIVKEVHIDDVNYFELKLFGGKPLHIHFKCSNCHSMLDIDDIDIIIDFIKINQKVEQKKDFLVYDADITLLGLCNRCKEQKEDYIGGKNGTFF